MDAPAFPPELLESPPRRLARRSSYYGPGCAILVLIPHVLVACGLLCWMTYTAVGIWAVAQFGEVTPGKVIDLQVFHSKKNGVSYTVQYRFLVGANFYDGSNSVGAATFTQLRKGQALQVQILPAAPTWEPCPVLPDHSPWASFWPVALFGLFWITMTSFIVWMIVRPMIVAKHLVRYGLPTSGVVTDKRTRSGKTTTYQIHYRFIPERAVGDEAASHSRSASTTVQKEDYLAAQQGDVVTVLYDPVRPHRSLIYEFADYRAVM
jgi:hypothetical protein